MLFEFTIRKTTLVCLAAMLCIVTSTLALAKEDAPPDHAWLKLSDQEKTKVLRFAEDYKDFMHTARTELSFVSNAVEIARKAGFTELGERAKLGPGNRYYSINRDRTITLIVIGSRSLTDGFRMVGAHIDSPQLELKARPLYEKEGFALFQTYRYGGIKNYQWVNLPLALIGHIDKKDGKRISVSIGLDEEDPILIIPDLSPHVDREFRERTNRDVIKSEELDPIVASLPGSTLSVEEVVTEFLKSKYGAELDDLVSAELALVPAMPPRDVGFDRALMAIYGQDDRLSSYSALRAIIEQDKPAYTSLAFLVNNEEVGSVNNTGAKSSYLKDLMSELLYQQLGDEYSDYHLRRALRNTRVVSSDVNPGVHPVWPQVWEKGNAPRLGHGVNLKMYGGGFNANSEYIAWTRAYLDEANIPWQIATYKGRASGGTIGTFLSKDNMEVIDYGVPVLSIHSTYAVSAKVDVYLLYRAMSTFYRYSG
jgi:aspartyl aminopeptidase